MAWAVWEIWAFKLAQILWAAKQQHRILPSIKRSCAAALRLAGLLKAAEEIPQLFFAIAVIIYGKFRCCSLCGCTRSDHEPRAASGDVLINCNGGRLTTL